LPLLAPAHAGVTITTTDRASLNVIQGLYREMSGVPHQVDALAAALQHTRARTLALIEAWCQALPDLRVPQRPTLNLPLWEWGHVGWFQTWWVGRNRQRALGLQADPDHQRAPPACAGADELYNSSTVEHGTRWSLPLAGVADVHAELARGLDETLNALEQAGRQGEDLYWWQLVLVHEDMHQEAALYMAQALGLPMPAHVTRPRFKPPPSAPPAKSKPASATPAAAVTRAAAWSVRRTRVGAQTLVMGRVAEPGHFCFDNECAPHERHLSAYEVDLRVVNWAEYLEFVQATGHPAPAVLKREGGHWWIRDFGRWQPVDLAAPAAYLSAADAQAWCRWAGRDLPTEAQWECAAVHLPDFEWGRVWEWTASVFEPYPGFAPHPYRDYSAPWFGTHRVLRGASEFTTELITSPSYRNFFMPDRVDIPAGFRTVARPRAV
jgi:EgtB-related family protein